MWLESKFKEMVGKTFGRWTVESRAHTCQNNGIYWWCRCSCGYRARVSGKTLRRGHSKSCGCLKSELASTHMQHLWDTGILKRKETNGTTA